MSYLTIDILKMVAGVRLLPSVFLNCSWSETSQGFYVAEGFCVYQFLTVTFTPSLRFPNSREKDTQTCFKRFCKINFKVIFILLCNAMVVQYTQYLFCNISEWLETFCGKCSRVQNDKQTMPNSFKVTFVIDVWHQPRQSRLRWRSGPQILT